MNDSMEKTTAIKIVLIEIYVSNPFMNIVLNGCLTPSQFCVLSHGILCTIFTVFAAKDRKAPEDLAHHL